MGNFKSTSNGNQTVEPSKSSHDQYDNNQQDRCVSLCK